jgi:hypothetical protein
MHFQETYTTALKRKDIADVIEVAWVVDTADKESLVKSRLKKIEQSAKFIGVEKFDSLELPDRIIQQLNEAQRDNPVDAVLVSTTPEQHRAYVTWALESRLNVLLDKPISTRKNATTDHDQAAGILDDWQHMVKLRKQTGAFVMINSHRRFHPAYYHVGKLLEEVAERYSIGVTSLSSFNSDGQWRLPNELEDITYHGYENGNGVISHFGYHYLDLITTWYRKGTPENNRADKARVYSSFSTALNYTKQIPQALSSKLLTDHGEPRPSKQRSSLGQHIANYGEVDSFNSIEFIKGNVQTAHASVQMLHSGFSQRAWTKPAENLYKENGRLRWENHLIQQGPLHAIEVRSFQAVQPAHLDPEDGLPRWELGGSDQLEINIYRNRLIGGKPLETIQVKDILQEVPRYDVLHEDVKAKTLKLFAGLVAYDLGVLDSLKADRKWKVYVRSMATASLQDRSFIEAHQPTVALMSAAYQSYAKRVNELNPIQEVSLQW